MRCVGCGDENDTVVDSRQLENGHAIRRRRECGQCAHRWTTYERREDDRTISVDLKMVIVGAYDELGELLKKL